MALPHIPELCPSHCSLARKLAAQLMGAASCCTVQLVRKCGPTSTHLDTIRRLRAQHSSAVLGVPALLPLSRYKQGPAAATNTGVGETPMAQMSWDRDRRDYADVQGLLHAGHPYFSRTRRKQALYAAASTSGINAI